MYVDIEMTASRSSAVLTIAKIRERLKNLLVVMLSCSKVRRYLKCVRMKRFSVCSKMSINFVAKMIRLGIPLWG